MTTISIVVPWRDHVELADDFFEATLPEMEDGDELIVVDDGSQPPLLFGTLRSEQSRGFSPSCNLGLAAARGDATLFVNNDVRLGKRGWLEEIRQALEPGVLVGQLRDGPHTEVDGTRYPYLGGWCLAGLTDDLRSLGGWDEGYTEPSYFGDNDLCLRARCEGMTLREVRPGLVHLENRTAGSQWDTEVQAATAANRERYVARVRELLVAA